MRENYTFVHAGYYSPVQLVPLRNQGFFPAFSHDLIAVVDFTHRPIQRISKRVFKFIAALEWMAENLAKDYGIDTKVEIIGVGWYQCRIKITFA